MPPRPYTGPRGSSSQPLLRDYLLANQPQGAQQAERLAADIEEMGQRARSAIDSASSAVEAARLNPLTQATAPFQGSSTRGAGAVIQGQAPRLAQQVLESGDVGFAQAGVGPALQQQLSTARDTFNMATTPAGIGALNRQRFGGPRTAGASLLDAAITSHGGGKRLRKAAAKQASTLEDYFGGAEQRGNEAAEKKAREFLKDRSTPPAPQPQAPQTTTVRAPFMSARLPIGYGSKWGGISLSNYFPRRP